ncbi:MAG: succinyl-CoA--3-ketoacid-CoA transferase, partial [Gammaproteobacteria bacterium]
MRPVPKITPEEAARMVPEGATLMIGGFGMTGHPVHLVHALAETSTKNLTYIGNNAGEPNL